MMVHICYISLFIVSYFDYVFPLIIGQPYDKKAGLTKREKQLFLDMHNAYRLKVALGQQSRQPPAADMIAMEWDDTVMRGAQQWSDTCGGGMHNTYDDRKFKPFSSVGQDYAGNYGVAGSVKTWYDEVKDFSYPNSCSGVCGHYTQVIWAKSVLVGCGFNECKGRDQYTRTHCDYAPGGNMRSPQGVQNDPYTRGKACSKCPVGFSNCMSNALCASQRACDNSDSKCVCTISSCENGGEFDSSSCFCKCKEGFAGPKCEKPCKDEINYCKYNMAGCSWDSMKKMWMWKNCQKSCKFCYENVIHNYKPKNTEGIKTNAFTVEHVVKTNCKNASGDAKCEGWAKRGECRKNEAWMKSNCAKACKAC